MIVLFADQDGDPVAVETTQIVGVSVGDLTGPRSAESDVRVTLIWAHGISQPFMVAAPFDAVVAAWENGRAQDRSDMNGWQYAPVVKRSRG